MEDGAGAVEKLINQRKLCFYHLLIDPGVVSLISLLARHFVGLFVCQSVTSIRWHFCIFFSLLFSVFWVFYKEAFCMYYKMDIFVICIFEGVGLFR